jgi:hypothetical protein
MEAEILTRAHRVADARAAKVFADPRLIRLLLAFVGAPLGLAAAARAAGMPLSLAHYHFGKLSRTGLVKPAGQKLRAGRPIALHQAIAEAFFVPAELMPPSTGLDRAGNEPAGKLAYRDTEGRMRVSRIRSEPRRSSEPWRMMATLNLDPAYASSFTDELAALVQRYASLPAGRPHDVQISVGPTSAPRQAGRRPR